MKKTIFIFVLAAALTACDKMGRDGRFQRDVDWSQGYKDAPEQDDGRPSVKIMSFNILYYTNTDATVGKRWDVRCEGVYEMMRTIRPVLLGTQECMPRQARDINAAVPEYGYTGVPRDGSSSNSEMTAIFYLKDSVEVLSSKTFWLSSTPDTPSRPPGVEINRCATLVKVRHISSGNIFWHLNTHLDLGAKDYEMEVILGQIASICGSVQPVVLTGDWNTTADDSVFGTLYETFKNARDEAIVGDNYNTFNGFTNPAGRSQIDHIFYRGFYGCSRFVTSRDKWLGLQYISDHFPVYAILKFQ